MAVVFPSRVSAAPQRDPEAEHGAETGSQSCMSSATVILPFYWFTSHSLLLCRMIEISLRTSSSELLTIIAKYKEYDCMGLTD